ncbi:unnamed protein product, partial [Durusdinium trenchii]
ACRNAEITLQGGSCIDLDCSVNNVGGSDCEGLTLTKEGSDPRTAIEQSTPSSIQK